MLLIYLVIVAIVVYPQSKCVAHVLCCLYVGLGNFLTYVAFYIIVLVECLIQKGWLNYSMYEDRKTTI
jgi:hypothetical protein